MSEAVETARDHRSQPRMNNELFGVFGDRTAFERHRSPDAFDEIVDGPSVTVGLQGTEHHRRHRIDVDRGSDGLCLVWGTVYTPEGSGGVQPASGTSNRETPAGWIRREFQDRGQAVFDDLDGDYLVVVDGADGAVVAGDLLRSIECFYTDAGGPRRFGTDAAAVARTIDDPAIDWRGLNQFLHIGTVFENRTLLSELRRMPFDGTLGRESTGDLSRFVYRPMSDRDVDHAARLADRLETAIRKRQIDVRPSGMLASAGYDSRFLLATLSDLDVSYTLGDSSAPEVEVARTVSNQYGVDHECLPVTDRYLDMSPSIVQYTNGIRESIHIHHRGNLDALTEPVLHHGLLLDTVLREIYLSRATIDGFGRSFPLPWLESDPNPVEKYRQRLGMYELDGELLGAGSEPGATPSDLFEDTIGNAIRESARYSNSTQNAMARLGIVLTPALPFRTQIADNHLETLVAADAGLVDWHLTTPARHRNGETFQDAIELIDDDILRHRPPDRPSRSYVRNQIDGFLRRTLPGLQASGTPWPDRDDLYERTRMDARLFPDTPAVHRLPPRLKLRIADALVWLESATGEPSDPEDILSIR